MSLFTQFLPIHLL